MIDVETNGRAIRRMVEEVPDQTTGTIRTETPNTTLKISSNLPFNLSCFDKKRFLYISKYRPLSS